MKSVTTWQVGNTNTLLEHSPHSKILLPSTHSHSSPTPSISASSPVSMLMACLLLVSSRMSMTSWANSSAFRVASFCRPWLRSGDKVGLTGKKAMELCSCWVASHTNTHNHTYNHHTNTHTYYQTPHHTNMHLQLFMCS